MRGVLHPACPGGEYEGGGAVSGRNREDCRRRWPETWKDRSWYVQQNG
jgi:hypothetical protein